MAGCKLQVAGYFATRNSQFSVQYNSNRWWIVEQVGFYCSTVGDCGAIAGCACFVRFLIRCSFLLFATDPTRQFMQRDSHFADMQQPLCFDCVDQIAAILGIFDELIGTVTGILYLASRQQPHAAHQLLEQLRAKPRALWQRALDHGLCLGKASLRHIDHAHVDLRARVERAIQLEHL